MAPPVHGRARADPVDSASRRVVVVGQTLASLDSVERLGPMVTVASETRCRGGATGSGSPYHHVLLNAAAGVVDAGDRVLFGGRDLCVAAVPPMKPSRHRTRCGSTGRLTRASGRSSGWVAAQGNGPSAARGGRHRPPHVPTRTRRTKKKAIRHRAVRTQSGPVLHLIRRWRTALGCWWTPKRPRASRIDPT